MHGKLEPCDYNYGMFNYIYMLHMATMTTQAYYQHNF